MKLPDHNLLIYAVDRQSVSHKPSVVSWNSLLSGNETVALSWSVLLGFLRVTTNPSLFADPLTADEPFEYVDRWLAQPITTVIEPTARHAAVVRDLLASTGAARNLVPDGHLAGLAIEHGAELCSAERDFGRFRGLRWIDPLA